MAVERGRGNGLVKRSEVNRTIEAAMALFNDRGFRLPPFSSWSPGDWFRRGEAVLELMKAGLGWDVVEWRPEAFAEHGLLLFTMRNIMRTHPAGCVDGYAEKLLLVRAGQRTPLHTHRQKMEDLINRGGGNMVIELVPDARIDEDFHVKLDGATKRIERHGESIVLRPGESITLLPGIYHAFQASGGDVIAGEVSTRNDDARDNSFADETERYPRLQEDERPERLLVADYPRIMRLITSSTDEPL
jgi:D-lyxose ketol-isomerase